MSNIQEGNLQARPWRSLTLGQYVQHRNGVPLGDGKSLQNMLHRSLGAASFAGFWQYWNPIWGYGLGKINMCILRCGRFYRRYWPLS